MRFSYTLLLAIALNFLWANGHDQQRCIELVVLGLGLLGALATGQLARAVQAVPLPLRGAALTFLALGACASVDVMSPSRAMAEWSMFVVLGLSALVIAEEYAVCNKASRFRLLQMLVLACGLQSLRVLLIYAANLEAHTQLDFQGLSAGFSNMRFLNHAQTALLPLLILLTVISPHKTWTRRAAFWIAAYWWSLIFFSESRATLVALASGVGAAWAVRGRRATPLLATLVATALAGATLYLLLYVVVPVAAGLDAYALSGSMLARSAADPISGRQFLWRRAVELVLQHPLLGVGPQHFAHFGADLQTGAHPHDWLLQIASEWGMPALLCVLIMLGTGMRGLLHEGREVAVDDDENQALYTTWIVAITGVVVDSLVSGVLVMPQSQLAVALVIGTAIGWVRSRRTAIAPDPSRATRFASAALASLALCLLAIVMIPDGARKWERGPLTAQEQAHNPNVRWPRLWEAGMF